METTAQVQATNDTYEDPVYGKFKNVLKGAKQVQSNFDQHFQGEVVTRFPPEPSGYLHIGHVKAAMLNYHYAKMYKGKMILRFDDTNPMNEKIEFVENITRDLKTLEITPDLVTYTSDYFDVTKEMMEKMITLGLAYADDTPAEEMKIQRDAGVESKYREATVEQNMTRFHLMLRGLKEEPKPVEDKKQQKEESKGEKKKDTGHGYGKKEEKKKTEPEVPVVVSDWCMRAKMNMQNPVKCLRDPVFYRIKREAHHRTGTKYLAYPTYDFACPIVDSLENVSHALRTIEYHDRNALYDWVQQVLGLRKVTLYDYSRLNLVSTVLSKRSLKWFVEAGHAEGWYDPRFPTVQGIMRRGLTVEALKQFMLEQGPSKNTNLMEWDKLWALNKSIIDPVAPRYNAIVKSTAAKVILENVQDEIQAKSVSLHPKNEALGSKAMIYGKHCYIERDDAKTINVDDKIALRNYGKVLITKKEEDGDNITLYGTLDLEDQNFKKVTIVTWICADEDTNVEIDLVEFDHLITKKKIEDGDDVKTIVNTNSRVQYTALAEGCMRHLKKGDILQLERRGYFFVDQIAFGDKKLTLNFIPDGKMKSMSVVQNTFDAGNLSKGKEESKGPNKAEIKKAAGNTVPVDGQAQPEGEAKGPSKKDLKKAAKKEQKKAQKDTKKDGQPAEQKPAEEQIQTQTTETTATTESQTQ